MAVSTPIKKRKRRKAVRRPPVALEPDELRRLLTVASEQSPRDWLMLLVGYWHGLRVSELVALESRNFRDGRLTVQRLKGSLKTTQDLIGPPEVTDPLFNERTALAEYLRNLRPNQKLFPISRRTADRMMKEYCELAEIPAHKRHMHALKHTCGRYLMPRVGAENTRQHLGQVDIRNTQIYGWVTDEEADAALKKALAEI